jgi:hypothetical protein
MRKIEENRVEIRKELKVMNRMLGEMSLTQKSFLNQVETLMRSVERKLERL